MLIIVISHYRLLQIVRFVYCYYGLNNLFFNNQRLMAFAHTFNYTLLETLLNDERFEVDKPDSEFLAEVSVVRKNRK